MILKKVEFPNIFWLAAIYTWSPAFKCFKIGQSPWPRSQSKIWWFSWKGCVTRNTQVKYQSSSTHCLNAISKGKEIKIGQTPRSRWNGQICCYPQKGLVSSKTHWQVKYQSSIPYCSKVNSKVKVFNRLVELQGQGYKIKLLVPKGRF